MIKASTLAALALGLSLSTAAWAQSPDRRNCATMEVLQRQQAENPDLAARMAELEDHTAHVLAHNAGGRVGAVNVTIPVVVHVLYKTAAQNISDAQIQTQIDVLNKDYAALNADYANVPALFAGIKSGSGIQFCLAKTDPSGNTTTGIRRVATTKTSFSSNDAVKYTSQGGDNAWDASKYLNIWVCNLGNSLLGYAQFPGGAAATDGVVILHSAFGTTGTAAAPFNKGRTATHEVGHWLNLRHIWGDANCGSDLVNDTPTQQTANYSCPSYPHPTCSNTSDMFMNYMDYVDDACMYAFSAGQVARMEALFSTGGSKASFLSATACNTGTPPAGCGVPSGLGASSVAQTTATLGWAAVTGATSYNLQYKTAAATTWTTVSTTATSRALTGLTAATAYSFQVQAVCASGSSAYSSAASFTTASPTTVTYCANAGGSTVDEWIAYFALGSIANSSTGVNSPGYQDFTALRTNLLPGSSYTATYRTGYSSSAYTEYYRMWIDYNRDGDFLDAGETVFSRTSSSSANLTSTFTVPATATLGATRLRIAQKYGSYLSAACTGYGTGWGQVEDYTVILGSGTGRELAATDFTLAVAPNPATDMSILQATLPGAEEASVRILDLQGRALWQAEHVATPGGYLRDYGVPVRGLKAGLYLIQVEAAGQRRTLRLAVE